ncbi:MAG: hypothetical protein ACK5RG_06860 [Cyclobacteriaceae bacterium]|nr:hypothetical protein [Flammeovirgaceae bacterium]
MEKIREGTEAEIGDKMMKMAEDGVEVGVDPDLRIIEAGTIEGMEKGDKMIEMIGEETETEIDIDIGTRIQMIEEGMKGETDRDPLVNVV